MLSYSAPDQATRVELAIADCFLIAFFVFMIYGPGF